MFLIYFRKNNKVKTMGQDGKKDAFNANAIFSDQYYKLHQKKFLDLAKNGQHPKTLYIGCSDSRVLPNLMTQCVAADLFVERNIGNFVAPFEHQHPLR